jgi:hypothetical protein
MMAGLSGHAATFFKNELYKKCILPTKGKYGRPAE